MIEVHELNAGAARACVPNLADVLLDCVEGGASVSFMAGLTRTDAEAFFHACADDVERGRRVLLGSFLDGALIGTVQAVWATAPNQPHRADIAKLLVRRNARHHGAARALMAAIEAACLRAGRTLLVLDTVTGDPAERLYEALGWMKVGVVPRYALYPDGRWCDTTFFYKNLSPSGV